MYEIVLVLAVLWMITVVIGMLGGMVADRFGWKVRSPRVLRRIMAAIDDTVEGASIMYLLIFAILLTVAGLAWLAMQAWR
jgi:hypothetical protein